MIHNIGIKSVCYALDLLARDNHAFVFELILLDKEE